MSKRFSEAASCALQLGFYVNEKKLIDGDV
jgi:hypothetical protein